MDYTVSKMTRLGGNKGGFTLVELMVTMLVIGIVSASMIVLFISLVHSAVIAKRQAVASSLATSQIEYLHSLPYTSLDAGTSSSGRTTTSTKKINGVTYTITTVIKYVDDAYDGCGSYITSITASLRPDYCRNYTSTSATNDSNFNDYKGVNVSVTDTGNTHLAQLDTEISARVAETASTTGALFVLIIDATGAPVSGASVSVTNSTVNPVVNVSDNTDGNGIVIFYGLPPDTGNDYTIAGSKSGYSSLTTIKPSGSLSPTYPSQNIVSQSSSYVTLTLKPMTAPSIVLETVNTSGTALANAKIYMKGGYKKYSNSTDTSYYYDSTAPCTTGTNTDSNGLCGVANLVPGTYIFCGDAGATGCSVSGTTYFLAAAVPYGGTNAFNPITVPTSDTANPPATTFTYSGTNYLQKVRLILTTSSSFPRVTTMTPDDVSLSGTASSFLFTITGTNLSCSSNAASCATSVKFQQGGNTFTASCTGNTNSATQLSCSVNMSTAAVGMANLVLSNSGGTLTLPGAPLIGGLNVTN